VCVVHVHAHTHVCTGSTKHRCN